MLVKKTSNNYAFIDSQNVHKGTKRDLGWEIDWERFRTYLREKYDVAKAYVFMGFIPDYQKLYNRLQEAGFIIQFKPVVIVDNDSVKGNVDADIVLQIMLDYDTYDQAILVSSDGDFYSVVQYLYKNNKLKTVFSAHRKTCSKLLRKNAKEKMMYLDTLENKLKKHRGGTEPNEVLFHKN